MSSLAESTNKDWNFTV